MTNVIASHFRELDSNLKQSQRNLFSDGRLVFIYGAGNVGKDIYQLLTRRGVRVSAFLDRAAKANAAWQGVPIYRPDDRAIAAAARRDAHVVMGIFNKYVEMPPLHNALRELGYGRITTFLDLYDTVAAELGDRYWLTARSYYLGTETYCQAAYDLLSDQASRDIFASILRFRFTNDYTVLPECDVPGQYFDKTLPPWKSPLRLIDCGAYDGDTLDQVLKSKMPVAALAAFEPDLANFAKLNQFVLDHRSELPQMVALYPCGVDATACQLKFSSDQGSGSHVDANGDTTVQCVSIDEALHGFGPNLIKMDIEGAELAALRGARRTMAEFKPGLAICLYHRPEHLWQVPLFVSDIYGSSAKYYLRLHSHNGFELVLYVIPE